MLKKLFSVVLLSAVVMTVQAQELNCKVKVLHNAIQNVDKSVFTGMERAITDFLNTRKWTNDQYNVTERIDCNIMINITKKVEDDIYEATFNIQASRPVYNSGYASPIVNFVDKDLVFKYTQFTPLEYNDNRISGNEPLVSNLVATLAFYSYIVLGLDYESFQKEGGTDFFKKAQNIANNAPEAKGISGWKPVEGNRNRYWLIDQILNPRFKVFRDYWYTLHRESLDNMYNKPEESRKLVTDGLVKLAQMHRENPGSILVAFFFGAKSNELASIVSQIPKEQRGIYITMLQQMDVPNAQKYNALK
ncbi:DUF4835 family protein [Polluticoccus soli]|uniref:type IX secretion system protein PorD n=1 Tax=Polluticoccus soli TaxID=3034150 RepID=UPI0023E21935|nr:DUF4835 family protein [Flavipsychrobacter sp. JY13-12]